MGTIALGAVEAGLAALWEHKPKVPDYHWTDLAQEQLDTAHNNLAALGLNEELGSRVNDFARSERAKTLAGIPGGADIEAQTAKNLKAWLSGQLSPEEISSTNRASNARAYASGYGPGGGPSVPGTMAENLGFRNLGLDAHQEAVNAIGLGQQYENAAYGRRAIPEWNPASMFINPMQAAQFDASQANQQWNRDWLAARIKAQPEAWQQSLMSSVNSIGSMADSIGGGILGGMVGAPAKPPTTPPPDGSFDGYNGPQGGTSPPPWQGWDYNPSVPTNPNASFYA